MVQVYDDENLNMSYRILDIRSESLEVPIYNSSIHSGVWHGEKLRGSYE